jgi:hypothetical protein
VRIAGIVLASSMLAAGPASVAHAQRTSYQGLTECSHRAVMQFMRHDPAFKRFVIDRSSVSEDKYADRVGNQFVTTIYRGKATYEALGAPQRVSFICLHGGTGTGAVFVYALPE